MVETLLGADLFPFVYINHSPTFLLIGDGFINGLDIKDLSSDPVEKIEIWIFNTFIELINIGLHLSSICALCTKDDFGLVITSILSEINTLILTKNSQKALVLSNGQTSVVHV